MRIRGVDFVVIPVADLARSAQFYREVLGLAPEVYSAEAGWAEFSAGNLTLALHRGQPPGGNRGLRVALAVDDVRAATEELRARGVAIIEGPTDHAVCWSAEIHDPDGNALLLHQRADGTWGSRPT